MKNVTSVFLYIETISSVYYGFFSYQTDSRTESRRKDIDCNTKTDIKHRLLIDMRWVIYGPMKKCLQFQMLFKISNEENRYFSSLNQLLIIGVFSYKNVIYCNCRPITKICRVSIGANRRKFSNVIKFYIRNFSILADLKWSCVLQNTKLWDKTYNKEICRLRCVPHWHKKM